MNPHAVRTPPFDVPWRHFVVALGSLPLALGLMAFAAPGMTAELRDPIVLASVHGLGIGWIAMVVMGALSQMAPVVLGVPLAAVRPLRVSHGLCALGLLGLVAGFALAQPLALLAGALGAMSGFLLFLATMAATLAQVKKWDLTAFAMAASLAALGLGLSLGVAMVLNQRLGFWGALHGAYAAHAHLLVGGWLTTLIAGVSYKLLPMFTLAYGHPSAASRWVIGLLSAGSFAWLSILFWPATWPLPAALLAAGALLYAWDAFRLLRRRKKRRLDTGLSLAVWAVALLPALVLLGFAAAWGVSGASAAYGALLLGGWVSWTLLGYLYKIVPFLVWFHRFGATPGTRVLAGDLVDARIAGAAGAAFVVGTLGAALGLGLGQGGLAQSFIALAALASAAIAADLLASPYRRPSAPKRAPIPQTETE